MPNLYQIHREELSRMLDHAQQRLDTLRQVVANANGEHADSDIRIAIGDALTPLKLAEEVMEPLP
jgi:hypothetical protein